MKWQKTIRLVVVFVAVGCAIGVAATMRTRSARKVELPIARTDPKAVLESAGGLTFRVNKEREEVRVQYQRLLTYADGSTKMMGLKVTTDRDDRTFVITGDEGQVADKENNITVIGNVRMEASDGLVVKTDRAIYTGANGIAQAPGFVEFSRDRMSGSGLGFTYDKNANVLTVLDQAKTHVVADAKGAGAMDVSSGAFEFRRTEKIMRFDRDMRGTIEQQSIEADAGVAHLTEGEEHLESLELRGHSKVASSKPGAGGLESLTGDAIDVHYGPDGRAIDHALITTDAVIQLAGNAGAPGRQISARTIDVTLASNGATATALTARDAVKVNMPAPRDGVGRTISAELLDSKGDEQHGLTSAHFFGNVQFVERGKDVNRTARSTVLDATMAAGFGAIDDATFQRSVRFVDGALSATSAVAKYNLSTGVLELTGSDPTALTPHMANNQVAIDATQIAVMLDGPVVTASGSVKSVLQPRTAKTSGGSSDAKMPSMFKQDQAVNVTSTDLNYEGKTSTAKYKGGVQLWQGETLIKASAIEINGTTGNLNASGPVATVSSMLQDASNGEGKERVASRGTSKSFNYDDSSRRATYSGDAHLNGPQGDLVGDRVELYMKPGGDEMDRVEAFNSVTLRSNQRKTTGSHLTYFDDDGRYLVNGTPVSIVDECGRETLGRTLTFYKSTDRILIDGNEQIRTQTKGKSNCSGS